MFPAVRVPPPLPLLAALLALAAAPVAARAQDPAERARLDSIRARFAAVTDTAALVALEVERIAAARADRDNPFLHMELGHLSYRLGELTAVRKRWEDAASEFTWAGDLRPAWPYAWYWLGNAELAVGEARDALVENIRQVLGQDALSLAARAYARAVSADPGFVDALADLAATALRQRISPRLMVAQNALRLAAATPAARRPRVLLMRGRIERRLGEADSAIAAFRDYLAVGGDSGLGGLELARSHAQRGSADSALIGYRRAAARTLSDSARAAFRTDVRWIASAEDLADFDRLAPDSVGPWLARFWARRELADGRRSGERIIEQFRRLEVASERYTLVSRRRGFDVAFAHRDSSQDAFDDRGVIYLRHGEPHTRASYNETGVEPNESWMYERPGQEPLVFHFVARNDTRDYRLVEALADILSAGAGLIVSTTTYGEAPAVVQGLYGSRVGMSPIFARIMRAGSGGRAMALADERTAGRRMVEQGTTSDSYVVHFAEDLRPVVSAFLVQGDGNTGELHVVFAIPAQRLQPLEAATGITYPLALRLQVHDGGSRTVALLDTLRVFRAAQRLGQGSFLTEQVVVHVPAGRWHYAFIVEELNRSSGSMMTGSALEVPVYGAAFEASDVVVGREGSGLVWRREGGEVPLNPLQRFFEGATATLWYELYGLPPGTGVETRVRIERRGGGGVLRRIFGGGGRADLSYTTVTDAAARSRVRQSLDLSGLSPGRYELVVELSAAGRRLERRQGFEIAGRAP